MAGDELQRNLETAVMTRPLIDLLKDETAGKESVEVVIDLNANHPAGTDEAAAWVRRTVDRLAHGHEEGELGHYRPGRQFVRARLNAEAIHELVRLDSEMLRGTIGARAIHRIWPDFPVSPQLDRSGATIKADAAKVSYAARGRGIVWAVVDSGIDRSHVHFDHHKNLELPPPLEHLDFSGAGSPDADAYGHGTHVAGIIAGYAASVPGRSLRAMRRARDDDRNIQESYEDLDQIEGVAPETTLVSYKVLDDAGFGKTGPILEALEEVQRVNNNGRNLKIHGVNLSLGYEFDPEWFACGWSPLCQAVERLVRSGVIVVVAAGNTGHAGATDHFKNIRVEAGRTLTINDPGNADLAITVGSTHGSMPHRYGVSYFSSKGPTGDGRAKPDIVAPGEKILSAASGRLAKRASGPVDYVEDTGTSMAAPHVSGALSAFLSIRPEFIGRPDEVKRMFLDSATDLGRVRDFQAHGLLDIMRAIQSV